MALPRASVHAPPTPRLRGGRTGIDQGPACSPDLRQSDANGCCTRVLARARPPANEPPQKRTLSTVPRERCPSPPGPGGGPWRPELGPRENSRPQGAGGRRRGGLPDLALPKGAAATSPRDCCFPRTRRQWRLAGRRLGPTQTSGPWPEASGCPSRSSHSRGNGHQPSRLRRHNSCTGPTVREGGHWFWAAAGSRSAPPLASGWGHRRRRASSVLRHRHTGHSALDAASTRVESKMEERDRWSNPPWLAAREETQRVELRAEVHSART